MNKQRLQIVAVVAVILFGGGMLYLRMGPGSRSDIPPEAQKIIQAAHVDETFEDGGSPVAERTGGTQASRSGTRLASEGDPRQADADSIEDEPEIGAKKKSSTRRKKGRKSRVQDDAHQDDEAPKSGKKVSPSKTAS